MRHEIFKKFILMILKPNKFATLLFKVFCTVFCFYLIAQEISSELIINLLLSIELSWFVVGVFVFWLAQIVSCLRCVYISDVLGKRLVFKQSLYAHFIGLWFNQVLPTGLGGDVVKVAILKKSIGFATALQTGIIDRLSGLAIMLFLVILTFPIYLHLFPESLELGLIFLSISLGALGFFIATIFLSGSISKSLIATFKLDNLINFFYVTKKFTYRLPLLNQLWTSLWIHVTGILTYMLCGLAIGVNLDFVVYAILVPMVFLIALLPISLAGWGIREAGSVWVFSLAGIPYELCVGMAILFGLLLIVAGVPGLFLWIIMKSANEK